MHLCLSLRRRLHINGKLFEQYMHKSMYYIAVWPKCGVFGIQSSCTMCLFEWFGTKSNGQNWLRSIAIFTMYK